MSSIFKFISILFLIQLNFCFANDKLSLKLPYSKGENFIVTFGYNSPDTHVGKDSYALDFALGGCHTFNQPVLAVSGGKVIKVEMGHRENEKGSYGNQIVIEHADGIQSRYAHLNVVRVKNGDIVKQGEYIGNMGATGDCRGTACPAHPGAHLHFAMYQKEKYVDVKGKEKERLVAYKPEPMSGFSVFTAGRQYESDNDLYGISEGDSAELTSKTSDKSQKGQDLCLISALGIAFDEESHSQWPFGIVDGGLIESKYRSIMKSFGIDEHGKIIRTHDVAADNGLVDSASAIKKEKAVPFEQKYGAKLINKEISGYWKEGTDNISAFPGSELSIRIGYKNIGLSVWNQKDVSLNILDSGMGIFYDKWLTRKRTVAATQNMVGSGEYGDFVFNIRAPQAPGLYKFGVRPVIFYENDFRWIGNDEASWNIEVRGQERAEYGTDEGNVPDVTLSIPKDEAAKESLENGGEISGKQEEKDQFESSDVDRYISMGHGGYGSVFSETEDISSIETYLSSFPPENTNSAQAVFISRSNFPEAKFKCRMDAGDFMECLSEMIYENIAEGWHTFEIKAIVGNKEDNTPAKYIFMTDRTAPSQIRNLQVDSAVRGEVNLSGTLPENGLSKILIYYKNSQDCSVEDDWKMENWSAKNISFKEGAGSEQLVDNRFEVSLEGLREGENYCFVARTEDLAGNISVLSNMAAIIINNSADHLLFSEIKLYGSGRFIEIYNPTVEDVDISGYSLWLSEDGTGKKMSMVFNEGSIVASHGFFLVADENFSDLAPDFLSIIPTISGETTVSLVGKGNYSLNIEDETLDLYDEAIIDRIKVLLGGDIDTSLERKAHPDSTSALMLISPHKYDGNGYDQDAPEDFLVRQIPEPQNSRSMKEPHKNQKPVIKLPAWSGKKYFAGEEINMEISVEDVEDGTIYGGGIAWYLGEEKIGLGTEARLMKRTAGKYDLSIEVTDSDGEKSSAIFPIEIIENGWNTPIEVSGADASTYGASIDNEGAVHVVFSQQSCDGEDCMYCIYHQRKEGDYFGEPAKIIDLHAYNISYLYYLDIKVDTAGVVHVIFAGNDDSSEENIRTYYVNSSDDFINATLLFRGLVDVRLQVEDDLLYVAAIDRNGNIYYKKFSAVGNTIKILGESSYRVNTAGITRYQFAVKDGKLYFTVLHRSGSLSGLPRQFSGGSPIRAVIVIPQNLSVAYLEVTDTDWSFSDLEGGFSVDTSAYIHGGSPSYILANDDLAGNSLLFAKKDDLWYRNELDLKQSYVFGFDKYPDDIFYFVSEGCESDSCKISWHVYEDGILRNICIFDGSGRSLSRDSLLYVSDVNGREGILFADYVTDKLYYMERG